MNSEHTFGIANVDHALRRRLGRVDALAIGVGSVIGTGIFRTTGDVLRGTGGFAGASFVWIAIALVSAAGALVYADLASRVPEAGGPYAYVREAFGRGPAFIDGGLNALVSIPARHAAAVGVIGEVLAQLLGVGRPRLLAVLSLASLVALNLPGVRAGARAQRFFTASKLALVMTVVILGVVAAGVGRTPSGAGALTPIPFATAVAACWYSFMGWQDAALLSEEMRTPARDIRFVLVATVAIVSAAYLAIHVALFVGLGASDAAGSFPALTLARRLLGAGGESAMSIALLVSMFGGAAESLLVRPRVLFALARDGLVPRALTYVNAGGTPAGAMLLHAAIVLALVATGSFRSLLAIVAFTQAFTGFVEAASALVLLDASSCRASGPFARGILIVSNALLCVVVAWENPLQIVYTGAAVALLAVVYPFVRRAAPVVAEGAVTAGTEP